MELARQIMEVTKLLQKLAKLRAFPQRAELFLYS
jgi:hypothetical protein